jgi:pimeloyl-ACP methyl ester carboxylesterase
MPLGRYRDACDQIVRRNQPAAPPLFWRCGHDGCRRPIRHVPHYVSIVIHNYRWRLSLADGESQYDGTEKHLAAARIISVPTITLEGDANGAPHPQAASYARLFSGKYAHRVIKGGIGHNLPQEAPRDFAQAIVDVDKF